MIYPIHNQDTIWRRIGDTIVAIDGGGTSSHILNKTAAFIWELCDGNLEIDEIATKVHQRFDVSLENAKIDVHDIIEELAMAGILGKTKVNRAKI